MESTGAHDHPNGETSAESKKSLDQPSPEQVSGGYRLFDRRRTIHQIIGGGETADVILWKQHQISFACMLLMAHDITLGKDFRLFFQVVVFLWILSVIGSSFFTLAYLGTIVSITVPGLYSKYEEDVDCCAGLVHQKFSRRYRIVNENVIRRLPRHFSKKKDT